MMKITVLEEIKNACPQFAGMAIAATVKNTPYCEALWQKIDEFTVRYRELLVRRTRSVVRIPAVIVLRARRCAVVSFVAFLCIR